MSPQRSIVAGLALAVALSLAVGPACAQQPPPQQPAPDGTPPKPKPEEKRAPPKAEEKKAPPKAEERKAPSKDAAPPRSEEPKRPRGDGDRQPAPRRVQEEQPPKPSPQPPAPPKAETPPPPAKPAVVAPPAEPRKASPPPAAPQAKPAAVPPPPEPPKSPPGAEAAPPAKPAVAAPAGSPSPLEAAKPAATPPATAPAAAVAPGAPPRAPAPAAALPAAPSLKAGRPASGFQPGFQPAAPPPQALRDVQAGRTQRVEAGGKRTVIQENDNRVIIKQDNRVTIIRHDETQLLAKRATDVRSQRRPDGTTQTVIVQPGGVQIYNIYDGGGRLVHRYRRDGGRDIDIIDNRRFYRGGAALAAGVVIGAAIVALAAPEIRIPREKYIVDYDRASDDDIYEALTAPPVERLERRYSLDEVRYNFSVRERMRRLDLDTVTFESGSWEVGSGQFPILERAARTMARIVRAHPEEVFLIEGHTDAVGTDIDNLTLSDRRAQAVAEILSGVFDVPPENLVTQGYGEQYLKVPTDRAERANRRVAIRRITPLMSGRP